MYLKGSVTAIEGKKEGGRERKRQVFHLVVHSSDDHYDQNWARTKPGTRTFFQVSQVLAGTQAAAPSSTTLSSQDSNRCPYRIPMLRQQLNVLCHSTGPSQTKFKNFKSIRRMQPNFPRDPSC